MSKGEPAVTQLVWAQCCNYNLPERPSDPSYWPHHALQEFEQCYRVMMLLRQVRWFGANGRRALDALRSTSALDWQFSRASGPGGQHVNKVNTRAELRLDLDRATETAALPRDVGSQWAVAVRRELNALADAAGHSLQILSLIHI